VTELNQREKQNKKNVNRNKRVKAGVEEAAFGYIIFLFPVKMTAKQVSRHTRKRRLFFF
jgi:hypothetical protein